MDTLPELTRSLSLLSLALFSLARSLFFTCYERATPLLSIYTALLARISAQGQRGTDAQKISDALGGLNLAKPPLAPPATAATAPIGAEAGARHGARNEREMVAKVTASHQKEKESSAQAASPDATLAAEGPTASATRPPR